MRHNKYNKSILFLLLIFASIISISIGYCAVNGITLKVEGIAKTDEAKILYIDNVELDKNLSSSGASFVSYDTEKTLLQISNLTLPKENVTSDTSITILVTLNNLSDITYKFAGVDYITTDDLDEFPSFNVVNSNSNIIIDTNSYKDRINEIIDANSIDGMGTMTIPIKFKYADITNITDNTLNVAIKLNFQQYEKQRYNLKTGSNLYSAISSHYDEATNVIFCAKSEVPDGAAYVDEAGLTDGEIKIYKKDTTLYIATATKYSIINFNEDSGFMFSNGKSSTAFSKLQSITMTRGVSIDTSNVVDFEEMFKGCSSLTNSGIQSFINHFDTSSATNMCAMFGSTSSITELDLSGFDTSNVTDMSWMFEENTKLIDVNLGGKFSTESVKGSLENQGFAGMFVNCSSLKVLDLTTFNTANVRSIWQMFKNCTSLEKIYVSDKFVTTGLATSNHYSTEDVFMNCLKLEGDSGTTFTTSQVTTADYAHFDGGEENPGYFSKSTDFTVTLNANGGKFENAGDKITYTDTNRVKIKFSDIPINEGYFFTGWSENKDSDKPQFYNGETDIFTKNTTLYAVWSKKLSATLKTGPSIFEKISTYKAEAEHIKFAYKDEVAESSIKIGNIDAGDNGYVVAYYNSDNKTIYFALTDKDYATITFNSDSSHMFSNGKTASDAFSLVKTIDVADGIIIDTSKVTNFAEIFKYNQSLTQASIQSFINRFDTSSVKNMCAMLEYLNIDSIDISKFNTKNVTDMSWLFHGSKYSKIILGDNFDSSNATNLDGMFQDLPNMKILDISVIKVRSGATINYMFGKCPSLSRIYVSDDSGFEKSGGGIRVFENDVSLVGGSGENETKFTSSEIAGTYARISTKDAPGYLTSISEK